MLKLASFLLFALPAIAAAPAAINAQPSGLPAGDGKALVEDLCVACHQTRNIQRSLGYSESGWRSLIGTMIDLQGSQELDRIAAYLAKHFPEDFNRSAVLVNGDAQIGFHEWFVPTLGQRSRDPIETPDGKIWWAGQWADLIGSIDRRTGAVKEYALPSGAKPHSVFHDHDGNIWYTGNGNGTIGKFDPRTEEITVFEMPDPQARDPHTAIADEAGVIWFTMQQSNRVGRLDSGTGDIKIVELPTKGSRPYGIKLDDDGVPWIACNGSNRLVRLDPDTMAVTEFPVPDERSNSQTQHCLRRHDLVCEFDAWADRAA